MPLPMIGNHLRIRVDGSDEYYTSRLVESSETHYYIDAPLHVKTHSPLEIGPTQSFSVEFHAQDGSLCRFAANRLQLVNMPALSWEIMKPSTKDVIRDQRREFVRVRVDLPVRLAVNGWSTPPIECRTHDMSGGGMAVVIPQSFILRPGTVLEAKFTLPQGNFPVNAKCFVIRVSDPSESGHRIASVQFIDLAESIRKRIIQFTFSRQRLNT